MNSLFDFPELRILFKMILATLSPLIKFLENENALRLSAIAMFQTAKILFCV